MADDLLVNNVSGGGCVNPLLRGPSRVAHDVRNGFVSVAAAERDYGVVVDPLSFAVDELVTFGRREALQ